jgi:hypothetical protein
MVHPRSFDDDALKHSSALLSSKRGKKFGTELNCVFAQMAAKLIIYSDLAAQGYWVTGPDR